MKRVAKQQACSQGCGRNYMDTANRKAGCPKCRFYDLCTCGKEKTKKASHCRSCRMTGKSGEKSYSWRGGRTKHAKGYVAAYIPEEKKYKFVHTIVMEEHLGRPLKDRENVHHKNGIRNDNRLENLELWVRPQPAGQRVEDLLKWVVQEYREEVIDLLFGGAIGVDLTEIRTAAR